MAKADVVAAGIAALAQAESDAFGVAYDSSFAEGVASVPVGTGGGFQQSDIDAAVAAAIAPLNQSISDLTAKDALDAQAAIDAKAQGDAALASMKAEMDALSAKEGIEAQTLQNLSSAYGQLQQVVSVLAGLQPVAPAPVDPAPVDPSV